jgi:hypothetical protein
VIRRGRIVVGAPYVTSWRGTCAAIDVRPTAAAVETAASAASVEASSSTTTVESAATSAAVPTSSMLSEGGTRRADKRDRQKRCE